MRITGARFVVAWSLAAAAALGLTQILVCRGDGLFPPFVLPFVLGAAQSVFGLTRQAFVFAAATVTSVMGAEILAVIVGFYLIFATYGQPTLVAIAMTAATGILAGLVVGNVQWIALSLDGVPPRYLLWMAANALGGALVAVPVYSLLSFGCMSLAWWDLPLAAGYGIVTGAVLSRSRPSPA